MVQVDMMTSSYHYCSNNDDVIMHSCHVPLTCVPLYRCGIAMDCWMVPVDRDLYDVGIQQPLLFINSYDFQWVENVQLMMKLTKPPDENGKSSCRVLTLM